MTWVKIDDGIFDNAKIRRLSKGAKLLYFSGLTYSARLLTDGEIDRSALRVIAALVDVPVRTAQELVDRGLWELGEDGFLVHDYLEYNPSREQAEAHREFVNQRVYRRRNLYSDGDLVKAVRARDGINCRYCGIAVNFLDRKGSMGGTYDHVDPEGDNSVENVVVACRGCNGRKARRTPEEAGMHLSEICLPFVPDSSEIRLKSTVPVTRTRTRKPVTKPSSKDTANQLLTNDDFMQELRSRFTGIDLDYECLKWRDHVTTKPPKGNYKNSLRNWLDRVPAQEVEDDYEPEDLSEFREKWAQDPFGLGKSAQTVSRAASQS